jgi:hypothetical protein
LAILDLIRIGVLIPALITVSHWYDIETITMSRTAVMELSIFKIYGVIFLKRQVTISDISSATWRPFLASAFMSCAITLSP